MKLAFLIAAFGLNVWALPVVPVTQILEGTYTTQGVSPYYEKSFTISHWANYSELKTQFVQGKHVFDLNVLLRPAKGNEFSGSGEVIVRYPDGTGCKHKIGMRVFTGGDHIFIRTNTPQTFPYNPASPCVAAGPYVWHNHPEPYFLNH